MSSIREIIADPNTLIPSPPSTIYTASSIESLSSTSAPNSSSARTSSWASTTICPTATQLPFDETYDIITFAAKELERISFAIFEKKRPGFLDDKDIESYHQLELSWACKELRRCCPNSLTATLRDWLPDIRHLHVHRNRITATAACKTMNEAALFANAVGFEDLGLKFKSMALEMDWCRIEMLKRNIILQKHLPADLKATIKQRLEGVLAAAKNGTEWCQKEAGDVSRDVREYTWEQKIEENPWSDPKGWGQDRDRRYVDQPRASSPSAAPSCLAGDKLEDVWRRPSSAEAEKPKQQAYVPPAKRNGRWRKP